jgi:pyocin large subunit-like protein
MMRKINLRFFLITLISICALSCSNQPTAPSAVSETNTGSTTNVKAGDFAPGELEAHYAKHGAQFGDITKEQYLENARALLNAASGQDVLEKTRSNGDVLHYRISTTEFAVMTREGRIRTYFKADYKYWMRQ